MKNRKDTLDKIKRSLSKSRNVLIAAHDNLDGDSIGSALAIGIALKRLRKKVKILIDRPVPSKYCFLPYLKILTTPSFENGKIDTLLVLDTAGWDQIRKIDPKHTSDVKIINIDHHVDNKRFGNINWVDPSACAVGAQIFKLLDFMRLPIDSDIAACLYTAVMTDTGSFQYSNTTEQTHKIAAKLISCGIRPHVITNHIYGSNNLSKLKLLSLSLSTLRSLKCKGTTITWMWITDKMLHNAGASWEDADGFIDYLKATKNTKIALVFKNTSIRKEIKVNFRSKDLNIPVNEIAHKFKGGGHPAAAGCTITGSKNKAEAAVLSEIKRFLSARQT